MALSNSTLRRYTPPTCTLEIAAKTSALSRFIGKSVLKDLRFELRFDDPRQPDDKRVTIRGDAGELELLYEAVNSYVQNFLESSPTQLPFTFGTLSAPTGSTAHENSKQDFLTLPASNPTNSDAIAPPSFPLESGKLDDSAVVPELESNFKLRSPEGHRQGRSLNSRSLATDIYLEPKGLLAHNLFLGHLATEESGPFVNLSVTQLFDLVTALDEYATEGVALPKPNALSGRKAPPAWAYTAAAVVAAVGVTATTMKLLDKPTTTQTDVASTNQQTSPSPSPTSPVTPTPAASIADLPTPTVPSPLATAPILPPPSPVKIPTTPSPLNVPLGNERPSDSRQESQRPSVIIGVNPTEPEPVQQRRSPTPVVPGGIASTESSSSPRPSPTTSSSRGSVSSNRSPSPAPVEKTPSQKAPSESTPTRTTKPTDVAIAPPLPNLPPLKPATSTAPDSLSDPVIPPASARTTGGGGGVNQSESAPEDTQGGGSLFDTIPQVKEVRDYLQQRWKPASDLTQILEYYVFLNSDGKVERIIPINKAAEENLNRTNIPRTGEPFVSPVQGEGNPKIRVVFSPDGKVQTFYEGREGRN